MGARSQLSISNKQSTWARLLAACLGIGFQAFVEPAIVITSRVQSTALIL